MLKTTNSILLKFLIYFIICTISVAVNAQAASISCCTAPWQMFCTTHPAGNSKCHFFMVPVRSGQEREGAVGKKSFVNRHRSRVTAHVATLTLISGGTIYSCSSSLPVVVLAAFCRNSVDGQWYSYDDSSVEPVPQGEVCTRGAYILFYQRRNTIPPWSASSSVTG